MAKWKLFGKEKKEDLTQNEEVNTEVSIEISEKEKQAEDKPIAEYRETLETGTTTSKTTKLKTTTPSEQRIWRDVDAIEENVDNIHIKKAKKSVTDVDKKVDSLIEKRKKR